LDLPTATITCSPLVWPSFSSVSPVTSCRINWVKWATQPVISWIEVWEHLTNHRWPTSRTVCGGSRVSHDMLSLGIDFDQPQWWLVHHHIGHCGEWISGSERIGVGRTRAHAR
jgi:hypothetical protein